MNSNAIAEIRFGLGRTPGVAIGDPARWLTQQLGPGVDPGPAASDVADALLALTQDQAARRDQARLDGAAPGSASASQAVNTAAVQPGPMAPGTGAQPRPASQSRSLFRADAEALMTYALTTVTPFRERLVWFWANHFAVSVRKGQVAPLVGSYVREAIRPHVTGRFGDMLLAVMRHPAMLLYLDNVQSAGPHSLAASRAAQASPDRRPADRGLNENLARECLELHTVGPAGTTQADVTAFAAVLSGWSIERRQAPLGFRFRPGFAEPGDKVVRGRRVPEGEMGGIAALQFLADHPATHRHLAAKLVQHFVTDTPPPDAVRRIEGVLRDSGGHLGAAAAELTRLPAAWQPLTKIRSPTDLVVATFRAAGTPAERRPSLLGLVGGLGQPFFGAPLPNGWPDTAAEWAGPEALLRRVDWAYGFANRPELPDPAQLADAALGPLLSAATASEMQHAGSRRDAITLLLASPEFQRR